MPNPALVTAPSLVAGRKTFPLTILPHWASIAKTCTKKPDVSSDIEDVNARINDKFEYIPENVDNWSSPTEFVNNGGGDCEDFAVYKFYTFTNPKYIAAGVLKDGNIAHAVCVIFSEEHDDWVVLDCMTKDIVSWSDYQDSFSPIYFCDTKGVYI